MRQLLQFDAVIAEVEEELLSNRLCSDLFELRQVFSRFYDQVARAQGRRPRPPLAPGPLPPQRRHPQARPGAAGDSELGADVSWRGGIRGIQAAAFWPSGWNPA